MESGACRRPCATRGIVGRSGARSYIVASTKAALSGHCQARNSASTTSAAPLEDVLISEHRQVLTQTGLELEYNVNDQWCAEASVAISAIRAYEMTLLRRPSGRPREATDSCTADDRKAVPETFCGRKTSGLLAAVAPCLHIVSVKPMHSTESLTQVMMFVWSVLDRFPTGLRNL